MTILQIAIVGRPNVGKSSLFNWLAGRRLAIVDNVAGVTRDRVTQLIELENRFVELVDTGGIGIHDSDNLSKEVEGQISIAIESAAIILFVVDTKSGITPLDELVAERLRHVKKPILCLANKADDEKFDPQASEFFKLGCGDPLPVSVHQHRNKQVLFDRILEQLPPVEEGDENEQEDSLAMSPETKIVLVGRRNVGKSTFVNSLAQEERMIVSEVPGTTRDSVDVRFVMDGKTFLAIDTPGLRKRKSVRTDVEFYSTKRTQRSIRRADVVLMMFDAGQRISKVDKQLCQYVTEQYKPCLFVVNKWDLMVEHMPTDRWVEYLRETFGSMWHVPIGFVTGKTGKNLKMLLNHAQMLSKQSRQRISTGKLNRLIRRALDHHPPPLHKNYRPKIYYATQVAVQPPTIVLICNTPKALSPDYRRYLLGTLRDELSFGEVPIKLYFHRRSKSDERNDLGG